MSKISKEDVKKISRLAALKLSDSELELYSKEIQTILNWIEVLQEVELENVEPIHNITSSLKDLLDNSSLQNFEAKLPEVLSKESCKSENYVVKKERLYFAPLREDIAETRDFRDDILANSPEKPKHGYLCVKKII